MYVTALNRHVTFKVSVGCRDFSAISHKHGFFSFCD
jgi:hypothetical protein